VNTVTLQPAIDQNWFIPFKSLPIKTWDNDNDEFDEGDEESTPDEESIIVEKPVNPEIVEKDDWIDPINIKSGTLLKATVITSSNGNLKIRLHIKGLKIEQNLSGTSPKDSIINVQVHSTEGKLSKGNFSVKVIARK